jgi:hypothetical protein
MYISMRRPMVQDQIIQNYIAANPLEMGSMGELTLNSLGPLLDITGKGTYDVNGTAIDFIFI